MKGGTGDSPVQDTREALWANEDFPNMRLRNLQPSRPERKAQTRPFTWTVESSCRTRRMRTLALFVAATLLGALTAHADTERRVALVVGNDDYEMLDDLNNAVRDARAVANTLTALGFETTLKVNAGERDIVRALRQYETKLDGGAVGLVYYAGHGVEVDGKNYLIPVDAEIEYEEDLESEALPTSKILNAMERARNRLNILILDACRDNPLPESMRSASGKRGLQFESVPSGVREIAILFSAAPGEAAQDGPPGGHGIFTGELLTALDQPGLTLEEVFHQVSKGVSRRTNGKQSPWQYNTMQDHFYFNAAEQAPRRTPVVLLTSSVDATIEQGGDPERFRIDIMEQAAFVEIYTTGSLDTRGVLMMPTADGTFEPRAEADGGGDGANFRISRILDSGTYYVDVHGVGSSIGKYTVHLSTEAIRTLAPSADEKTGQNGEYTSSLDVATNSRSGVDRFRIFVRSETPYVKIHTTGNLNTELGPFETDDGTFYFPFPGGDGANFRVSEKLDAGTYYFKLRWRSRTDKGQYAVHLSAAKFPPDHHGGEPHRATVLASSVESSVAGWIGQNDVDYLRFEVTKEAPWVNLSVSDAGHLDTTGLSIRLMGMTDNGSVEEVVRGDPAAAEARPHIARMSMLLDPGTYFVELDSDFRSPIGKYLLKLEAFNMSLLTSSVDGILSSGEVDYFRIEVAAETPLTTIYTTGDLDTDGILMRPNADGTLHEITTESYGGDYANFRISRRLDPGTYYVAVRSDVYEGGDYTVHLNTKQIPKDDHGDYPMDATMLTSLSSGWTVGKDVDVFRIEVTEEAPWVTIHKTGDLYTTVVLGRLTEDRTLQWIDRGYDMNFRISRMLDAGTYYVAVEGNENTSGDYAIHLNARQLPKDEHGDDPMGATLLVSSLDGWIVGEDVDVFRIEITEENSWVEIHASGDIVTRGDLMKATGRYVDPIASYDSADYSRISRMLEPGTYYVTVESKVESKDEIGEYTIHLKLEPVLVLDDDHEDEPAHATVLTSSADGKMSPPDMDAFRIDVTDERSWVTVYTTGGLYLKGALLGREEDAPETNAEYVVYPGWETIAVFDKDLFSVLAHEGSFRVSRVLDQGTYYVLLAQGSESESGAYTIHLRVAAPPADDYPDDPAHAVELKSSVGGFLTNDDVDYFRVTVTEEAPWLTVNSTGDGYTVTQLVRTIGHGADVDVIAQETVLPRDPKWSNIGSISRILEPGAYLVRVQTIAGAIASGNWVYPDGDRNDARMIRYLPKELREYTLSLDARAVPADDHSDQLPQATVLTTSVDGWIGGDDTDCFEITIAASAPKVAIYSTGRLRTRGVLLKRSQHDRVVEIESDEAGSADARNLRISRGLEAGTYYVCVQTWEPSVGQYTLNVEIPEPAGGFAVGRTTE